MRMCELLDVAQRELAIRRAVYARKVAEGRMAGTTAEYQIRAMGEIADVLAYLSTEHDTSEALLHPEALQ